MCCKKNIPWEPYKEIFFDPACSVKMAGYWPHSFFLRVSKTELGPCPAILTSHLISNCNWLLADKEIFHILPLSPELGVVR